LKKFSASRSKIPGERILIDISYIKKESLGGKNTWLLVKDHATSMKWSFFMRRKGELIQTMLVFIKTLKAKNPENVKFIRLDNAGENLGLKTQLELEGINVSFEYTSPETPEQNGQVEKSFATLWGRVRAMLNCSGVPQEMRDKLWAECASTATLLSNVMSRKDGKSPHEAFHGKEAGYSRNLRIFGEVGIKLTKLYGLPDKLSNKGNHCLFLGYAEDHPKDTYRVLDLKNQLVMLTRNVRWLGKTHGEFFDGEEPKNIENTDLESSDEEEIRFEALPSTSRIPEEKKEPPKFTMITRSRALMDDMEDEESDSGEEVEGDKLMMIEESYVNNPRSFSEAFYHPEKEKQKRGGEKP
jgi:hypothetical protein